VYVRQGPFLTTMLAIIGFRWRAHYFDQGTADARVSRSHGVFRRCAFVVVAVGLIWSLCGLAVVQRGYVTREETGEKVYFRESIGHFLRSPLWEQMRTKMRTTVWKFFAEDLPRDGWQKTWRSTTDSMDLTGSRRARRTLGVDIDADFVTIKKAYRALVLENHPDKQDPAATEEQRAAAEERFREIQSAYETLSKLQKEEKTKDDPERTAPSAAQSGTPRHGRAHKSTSRSRPVTDEL